MKRVVMNGFTLMELLVTLAIVGILMSIAIPQYASYKKRAFDTRAVTDLRSVALAEEAYFLDWEAYLSCSDNSCESLPGINKLSKGVLLTITATTSGFTGSALNQFGSGRRYRWDSENGGLVE